VVTDGEAPAGPVRVLALGEAKATRAAIGQGELRRLECLRGLLERRADLSGARLLLFSSGGFEPALRAEARRRDDVELVDLDRLYGGD
jgi:hypothetical protein